MKGRWTVVMSAVLLQGCVDTGNELIDGLNLFSVEEDMELGRQLRDEIAASPDEYPLLDEGQHPEIYNHLFAMRDAILDTPDVEYADTFDWELYVIDDDETLNAFAAPGGYIYVYSGLIEFLEHEDELVGVLGHEIAHADQRHSTQQLTKAYGVQALLTLLVGEDPGLAASMVEGLVNLSFGRSDETEADTYSVLYLCETVWAADGAAGFFEKLEGIEIPEFLSTHPSSETRVSDIQDMADSLGCDTALYPDGDYDEVVNSLP